MIDYADLNTKCRSVILLDYFGEEADRCGICDVCRERNELDLSKYEFDIILEEIKEIVGTNKFNAQELTEKVNFPEEKVIKVIRWLLDHNKLISDADHYLAWRN